ncbi:uncharacterized protein FIBRA_09183 [Fibroporia radiculosa]|uniref:Uncharacterized protein n=1 Tax=Fibroporia radiculosa TaxID=599839 RepID=J4GY39_9APHY|nr:uncharacterized protein FIBRA_09183 [Fibroporia radiculosa]CCM06875.1 predicted protein [Fibroporia radiculosa]
MTGPQRTPTSYPSHLQALEERFTAGIIEMPTPRQPILSFPSQQESDDSLLESLDEGGFRYPFAPPLSNVTHRPFLIPGPLDSSNSDAVVLHQFPGPLEVPHVLEASSGSYHVAPTQVFPSSSPMNISSSPNPDSPAAASTDSPSMPPLASDASDNGSLNHAPNLQLLADVSEYITASEGHSSNPQDNPFPSTPPPQFKMSTPWNVYYPTSLEHTLPLLLALPWAFPLTAILLLAYIGYQQLQQMYFKLLNL